MNPLDNVVTKSSKIWLYYCSMLRKHHSLACAEKCRVEDDSTSGLTPNAGLYTDGTRVNAVYPNNGATYERPFCPQPKLHPRVQVLRIMFTAILPLMVFSRSTWFEPVWGFEILGQQGKGHHSDVSVVLSRTESVRNEKRITHTSWESHRARDADELMRSGQAVLTFNFFTKEYPALC